MASAEHRLISRIVRTGGMEEALTFGITEEDFLSVQYKGIWLNLHNYYKHHTTRNSTPPPDAFRETFSQFEFPEDAPGTTTKALCYEVRKARLVLQLRNAVVDTLDHTDDPVAAAMELRGISDSIISAGSTACNDLFLSTHVAKIIETYKKKESGEIHPVFRWPWEPLDKVTGGVTGEDYVLFYGRPKSKKTFTLTYLLAQAYEQGGRTLCYTKEMTPDHILLRIAAFLGQLPYNETRLGQLTEEDKNTLLSLEDYVRLRADVTKGDDDLIVLSGQDSGGCDGVMWLRSKIRQYKPKVLFVDGLYLMNDDAGNKKTPDWQRVMHISRDMRQLVLETGVPVIATMQANRAASKHQEAEFDEIAYSDAVGQDVTQMFRVINEKGSPTVALVCGGSRDYDLRGIRIYGVPCTNFGFHSIMSGAEIDEAKKGDDTTQEDKKRKARAKAPDTLNRMLDEQLREL